MSNFDDLGKLETVLAQRDKLMKALRLARARIGYLGAACNDPRHFEANASTFLPAIDEVLSDVGAPLASPSGKP